MIVPGPSVILILLHTLVPVLRQPAVPAPLPFIQRAQQRLLPQSQQIVVFVLIQSLSHRIVK